MHFKTLRPLFLCFLAIAIAFSVSLLPHPIKRKYDVALTAIFRNDGPWLKEWIEYYKLLGVEHFRLYNNASNDNSLEVLQPYVEKGEITVVDWPSRDCQDLFQGFVYKTQVPAYDDAMQALKGVAKWVVVVDTDEFIVPHKEATLNEFLAQYNRHGGVAVHWVCYGTSGVKDLAEGQLLTESLLMRSSDTDESNQWEKSIVRPEFVKHGINPHTFAMRRIAPLVNANFQKHEHCKTYCKDKIQVNHYHVRTENYFLNNKIAKKQVLENRILSSQEIERMLSMGNHHLDLERYIFRFIPTLKAKIHERH